MIYTASERHHDAPGFLTYFNKKDTSQSLISKNIMTIEI